LKAKENILKIVGNQKQLTAPIDFHRIFSPLLWKSMGAVNCLVNKNL